MSDSAGKRTQPASGDAIVTFDSTTDALTFEQAAQTVGLKGRLIPVPRHYSANCGLAWREPAAQIENLLTLLTGKLRYAAYYRI